MTSTVISQGQFVVPKALRERFNIKSGATLDWLEDGQALRVIKLEPRKAGNFLEGLRRLGRCRPGGVTNVRLNRLWRDEIPHGYKDRKQSVEAASVRLSEEKDLVVVGVAVDSDVLVF